MTKLLRFSAPLLALALCLPAAATPVRIGFITDMSGPYANMDGPAGADMIRMAIADFGGKVLGRPVELLAADHENNAQVAAATAHEWITRRDVQMVIGGANPDAALALNTLLASNKRVFISVGAGTPRLSNEECTPYTVHYGVDAAALARATGLAMLRHGGKSWHFLTADIASGHAMENDAAQAVKAGGGAVLGATRHPSGAGEISPLSLRAAAAKAQVLGLATAGGDLIDAVRASRKAGVDKTMRLAALQMTINDVHALGMANIEGMYLTDSWYWDRDEESRSFATRFFARYRRMPSSYQAADYSAAMTYLRAVQAAGTLDAGKVMAQLKSGRLADFYNSGHIRADGRYVHPMTLYQVKPARSLTKPWAYLKTVAVIDGEQAFATAAQARCPLLKR